MKRLYWYGLLTTLAVFSIIWATISDDSLWWVGTIGLFQTFALPLWIAKFVESVKLLKVDKALDNGGK